MIKLHSKSHSGYFAKVDDSDYEYLSQWKWGLRVVNRKGSVYAYKSPGDSMAREIMYPPKGKIVDHINHDTLDNQRHNLRVCTYSENMRNRGKLKNNISGIIGVHYSNTHKVWKASIKINGKNITLGASSCPLIVMLQRKKAEKKYFGEYAFQL